MIDSNSPSETRRGFLKTAAGAAAVASTLSIPQNVHAAGNETIKVGLIGCGGRGTGAAVNALNADPDTQLVALGDAFQDRLDISMKQLERRYKDNPRQFDVPKERQFIGFDAFQKVIDADVDVVILTTSPHFRPEHLEAAVSAGKHCFVEKPVGVDVPGIERVRAASKAAEEKGLNIVSGLCWRYDKGVRETMSRIQDGAIGEILAIESKYNAGGLWHRGDKPEWSRMEYQMRNWLYYTWLSGDHICEQAVHSLDKTAWLNGDVSPIAAYGMGGRQQRTDPKYGNIYDHHAVTYEYESGIRVFFTCRQQGGCMNEVDEFVIGTKGTARILRNEIHGESGSWKYAGPKPSMYDEEHRYLFEAIRSGDPINNGHYMCNSSLLAVLGRGCTYTGKKITWDELMGSKESLGPEKYEWTDVPEPPVAMPGKTKFV